MNLQELEQEARNELAQEKADLAKGVLKERIREIEKTERVLAKLKAQYRDLLSRTVEEVAEEEEENGHVRF